MTATSPNFTLHINSVILSNPTLSSSSKPDSATQSRSKDLWVITYLVDERAYDFAVSASITSNVPWVRMYVLQKNFGSVYEQMRMHTLPSKLTCGPSAEKGKE